MTNTRSYKPANSDQVAIEEIKRCSNSQFDPIVVGAFLAYYEELEEKSKKRLDERNLVNERVLS
jgi:HD-GYP domain-containing protein (c-di-GMP phosphodiesterase class II)